MGKDRSSEQLSSGRQAVTGNDDYYEVEQILDRRKTASGMLYYIKWKNYPDPKDFTWEPIQHLRQVKELVDEFERNYEANRLSKSQARIAQYLPKIAHEKGEKVEKKQKLEHSDKPDKTGKEKSETKLEKKQKRESSSEGDMQIQQPQVAPQKKRGRKKGGKNKSKMVEEKQKSQAQSEEEEKVNSLAKNNEKEKDKKDVNRRRNRSKQRENEYKTSGDAEKDKLRRLMFQRLFEEKKNLKLGRVRKHYYIDGNTYFNVNVINESDRVVNLVTVSLAELKAVDQEKLLRYLEQYYQNYLRMEEFKQNEEYLNFQKHWKNIS